MKKIFYSPLVSLSLLLVLFYFVWNYWSFLSMLAWVIFMVLYYEKALEWRKNNKKQNKDDERYRNVRRN